MRSLFPADLYKSTKRMAKGAFAHVHQCSLPVEGTVISSYLQSFSSSKIQTCFEHHIWSIINNLYGFKADGLVTHLYVDTCISCFFLYYKLLI